MEQSSTTNMKLYPCLCWMCCVVIFALVSQISGENSENVKVQMSPTGTLYAELNASVSYVCEVNRNLSDNINKYQQYLTRQAPHGGQEVVLSQLITRGAADTTHYNLMMVPVIVDNLESIRVNLTIYNVRNLDEGTHTCLVKLKNTEQILAQDSMQLSILRPVEDLCIKLDNFPEICNQPSGSLELDPGRHNITCSASGSNPPATLHLFHQDKEVNVLVNKPELLETNLTTYRSSVTGNVHMTLSTVDREFKCTAESQLDTKELILPYKIKKYDPDITCNTPQVTTGHRYSVKLNCTVDVEGFNVTRLFYEYDSPIVENSKRKTDVQISKEYVSPTEVVVQLELKGVRQSDFNENLYLVVEQKNGHMTRRRVPLAEIPDVGPYKGSGGAVTPSLLAVLTALVCIQQMTWH